MHSLRDLVYRKENPSPSAPGDGVAQGSDEIQDGTLTKRFEGLEKQLSRLESIGLSGSDPPEPHREVQGDLCRPEVHADVHSPENVPRGPIPARPGQQVEKAIHESAAEAWHKNIGRPEPPAVQQITIHEPFARMDRLPERYPPALSAQLGALQSRTIQECRAEIARLSQETIEGTRCQMNSLANEISCLLQVEMKKSLGNLTGAIVAQMTQSLERQVETATRRTAVAALGCARSVVAQFAAGDGSGRRPLRGETEAGQGSQACQGQLVQALPPGMGEVQNKSAALLGDLQRQLQNVLHAFQERAARQVAEEFQAIAGELLQREIKQLQIKGPELEQPSESLQSETELSSSRPAEWRRWPAQRLASLWPKSNVQGSRRTQRHTIPKENTERPGGNAPQWRILGLG